MKIHVLGTGHADVFDDYNTCFVMESDGGEFLLVDAGNGNRISKQLSLQNLNLNDIEYAFVSHNHADHMLGFAWILRYVLVGFMNGTRTKPFTLYGMKQCIDAVRMLMLVTMGEKTCGQYFDNLIHFKEVRDGEILNLMGLDFIFFDTCATDMPQMAFYVKEKGFYFCGDVPLDPKYYDKFKNSKWLCLEAFCLERERAGKELPLKKHKTVKEASMVAETLQAENLILWHSQDNHNKIKKEYEKEAREVYNGNIIIPKDLDTLEL